MKKAAVLACAMLGVGMLMWITGLGPTTKAANAQVAEPREGFLIKVEIEEISGFFTEVSGLGSESEVVERKVHRASLSTSAEGDAVAGDTVSSHEVVHKIPGRVKWLDISLKRGVTSDLEIWQWRKLVEDGSDAPFRKNGSITMIDGLTNKPVAKWNFTNAWPAKLTGPQFKADGSDVAIETLTIVHEGLEREF